MNYWLDLFTGTTWKEFRDAGSKVSGFNPRMRAMVSRIKQGDMLLCHLTGVMRWVGALEVIGQSSNATRIWKYKEFPVRLEVRPLVQLDAEHGVPMESLEGNVDFYEGPHHRGKFRGSLRGSPALFKRQSDGDLILQMLRDAESRPVLRPVDPKKLARKPFFRAERRNKVEQELLRPTFSLRERPLSAICGFLPFSVLIAKAAGIRNLGLASSLKPDFLERAAEFFGHSQTAE